VWSKNIGLSSISSHEPSTTAQCDDSLWDHAYNPQRLIVSINALRSQERLWTRRTQEMLTEFDTKPMVIHTVGSNSILLLRIWTSSVPLLHFSVSAFTRT
jgi:hypothetical protein